MRRRILAVVLIVVLMLSDLSTGINAVQFTPIEVQSAAETAFSTTIDAEAHKVAALDYGKIPEEYTNQRTIQLDPMLYSNMYTTRYIDPEEKVYNSNTEMVYLSDGILRLAVYWNNHLYVNDYSADYTLLESRDISLNNSEWGGICLGEEASFVLYGRSGTEEDTTEYLVVRYDADFNETATITLNDYTSEPLDLFGFSNAAMGLRNHVLTIFTDRNYGSGYSRYYAFSIKINVRELEDSGAAVVTFVPPGNLGIGGEPYRNFLAFDGNEPVYGVATGDDYPGGLYIRGTNGTAHLHPDTELGDNEFSTELILTDASSMAVSSSHYLVATIYENYGINNIYLAVQEKETGTVSGRFLTHGTAFNAEINGNPWIVDLGNDRFVLMWEHIELGMVNVCSVVLDASGTPIGQVQTWRDCFMSESAPTCTDGRLHWVAAEGGEMVLHQLCDLDTGGYQEPDDGIVEGDTIWDGTSDTSWYQNGKTDFCIFTSAQLAGLSELVNAGNDFSGTTIRLENDLFMNSAPFGRSESNQWVPIGASENGTAVFNGTFDGQCHTIYNMLVPSDGLSGGVFGTIGENGTVKCLTMEQGWFGSSACVADTNYGNVLFCMAKSYVNAPSDDPRGGVCRYNYGLIYGCQNYGFIEISNQCGGIVYRNEQGGTISQCANKGLLYTYYNTFTKNGTSGIAYRNDGWLYNCYNLGAAKNASNRSAGIVGYSYGGPGCGQVYNCYSLSGYPLWAPICINIGIQGRVENCFGNTEPGAEWYEEFCKVDFLTKLDEQLGPKASAWLSDTLGVNNGLPIPVAEYNYHMGNYKVQPELWGVSPSATVILSEQDTISLPNIEYYFSDAPLEITSDNVSVAEVVDGKVHLYRTGTANILFHLDETEESMALDYTFTITVKDHSYGEWIATIAPTCTTVGEERRECVDCDAFETRTTSALGHDYVAVVTEPSCTQRGYTTYQCSRCEERYVGDYVDMADHTEVIDAAIAATCTTTGLTEGKHCAVCGEILVAQKTVEALGHSFTNYVSDGNATCTEDGTKTAECDHCDVTVTIPDVGSALGHDMGGWENTVPATCTENGEEQRNCSRCDHSESRVIEAVGHQWDKGIVTREPTEETEGERLYTCTACGATKTKSIPVIGHEHSYETVVTAPTCTERGYTTCTCKCGESYVADYVDALGHSFGNWIMIQEPTTTVDGLEERSCTRCGHTEQRSIAKLENPFSDVVPGSFFYDPVMWAIENGITNGTSATTFSPNDQCMRAHVVTFLWRAVGSPEPTRTNNPFVDVKPSDFYYKPVLWALENGITSGMDATHFGPTSYCNRAQVVTFL